MAYYVDKVIEETFFKLIQETNFDHISIKKICDEAHVSRASFYYNYTSIDDLCLTIIRKHLDEEVGDYSDVAHWQKGFANILRFLKENKAMVDHFFNSNYRETFLTFFRKYSKKTISHAIKEEAKKLNVMVSESDLYLMTKFYTNAFVGMAHDFILEEMKDDPDELANKCNVLCHGTVDRALKELAN